MALITPGLTFYQVDSYLAQTDKVVKRHIDHDYIHISEKYRPYFHEVMHYFDGVSFDRAGILHGEYALINEIVLIRRDGLCIKANIAWENAGVCRTMDEYFASDDFKTMKKAIIDTWDHLPVIDSPIVMSHPYAANYFHWTFEVVPKNRFFSDSKESHLLIPEPYLKRLFQKDLLRCIAPHKTISVMNNSVAVRVKDPLLSVDEFSEDAILWVREQAPFKVKPGNRRIYLRRSTHGTRSRGGGGISENPAFVDFINEYGFETVDYGDKELTIEQQVMLLDNAGVILAPHGAALSNLIYLNAPLSLIEFISPMTPRAVFMHIASLLKFDYYGIYSNAADALNNLIPDTDELRDIMNHSIIPNSR